jgi:hypothetical protein
MSGEQGQARRRTYTLDPTTQGPLYPPSEVLDADGNFIVAGAVVRPEGIAWGRALVAADTPVPPFGKVVPYRIVSELDDPLTPEQADKVLYTLPLPLPANNYPMLFAPDQAPDANSHVAPSYPFHEAPIPDLRPEHGRRLTAPVRLGDWLAARGTLTVTLADDRRAAEFAFTFENLIPESLYTIMSLREGDLDPARLTRPGPLGVPNVFVTDRDGRAGYRVDMPDPFPSKDRPEGNRIINVIVLWMSRQTNHGGAIGIYGLGGDIHAQLKLRGASFQEFETVA